jgi:MoaA/NifB/PqqE/SkfB family radical SAM enzyme
MERLVFSRYTPREGHPDWNALSSEAHELAARLRPRIETPRTGPTEWRRRAQSWRTAAQNYAGNLRRTRAGREDLWPLYFIWTTLRPCNFRCSYCDDHRGARYPELDGHGRLDTAAGKRLLRVMRTRTPSVYFAGGEPTLRRDLPELIREARDLDYYPIVVNTNGSLFHRLLERPEWRTFLADVDLLVVSLDALELDTLERMWVTKHPEDVIRNLLMLRELADEMHVKLMVNTVIQPGLVQEARSVLDLADDLGIWFCPVPQNKGPRIDPDVLADPDYQELARTIVERKRAGARISGSARMNDRLLHAAPLDCRNTLKPHVDHDGKLAWPCKASANVEPVRIDVLDFDSVDALYAHARRRIDPTHFHGPRPDQCGGDCNWAQNYTTDEYAWGLRHPAHLARELVSLTRR